jgi:hypothetical protein
MKKTTPAREVRPDRLGTAQTPPQRGRRADKALCLNLGAGSGCAPALAALPRVGERCKIVFQQSASGECRLGRMGPRGGIEPPNSTITDVVLYR